MYREQSNSTKIRTGAIWCNGTIKPQVPLAALHISDLCLLGSRSVFSARKLYKLTIASESGLYRGEGGVAGSLVPVMLTGFISARRVLVLVLPLSFFFLCRSHLVLCYDFRVFIMI